MSSLFYHGYKARRPVYRPPLSFKFCLQLHEPHQHRGALRAGCGALRLNGCVGHAGDDAVLNRPGHRCLGVIADTARVSERAQAVAARGLAGVAPEHGGKLIACYRVVCIFDVDLSCAVSIQLVQSTHLQSTIRQAKSLSIVRLHSCGDD